MKFREHLKEMMEDEDFRKEYETLQPQYEVVKQIISAREELHITQKDLAERTGIRQSNISRLERGNYNPSVEFLRKIAKGLGKELHIEFR
ncbi:MAG: helix-turn-helix transcriptional regulator [Anaeromusa sp.]|jgi:predicted transcriptional regulator|uniref:helix-turn-helix domain-containing protein n=1 Tax=Anaeromusa sp. TaxID=1872520 RepID=UPI002B1EE02F|nr:helix-turn-helix transcriptional regulator [Anaeromusa sp.]MEA4834711.1 helix-turn-helix transcriptional regulator [Anaeromusa sp.]NCB77823.1 XRE family transcriptional regulator [Negativicutes bacterium]